MQSCVSRGLRALHGSNVHRRHRQQQHSLKISATYALSALKVHTMRRFIYCFGIYTHNLIFGCLCTIIFSE